jgi:hypothetical protein
MIAAPTGEGVLSEQRFKIVDLGSLKPSTTPTMKPLGDLENFVGHLVELWNVISDRSSLPGHDKRFLQEAENLLALMLDPEPCVALRDTAQIAAKFKEARARCALPISANPGKLNAPFEFLSAEQIADDRVLVGIFAKSCPWLSKVVRPRSVSSDRAPRMREVDHFPLAQPKGTPSSRRAGSRRATCERLLHIVQH